MPTSTLPSTPASQPACFRRQSCPQTSNACRNVYCLAPIFSGTGLTGPPKKILPPQTSVYLSAAPQKPRPSNPECLTFNHGSALPSKGCLAPPVPPCPAAPPATAVAEGALARGGREGAGVRAASGQGAPSCLSPPWLPPPFPPPRQCSPWFGATN